VLQLIMLAVVAVAVVVELTVHTTLLVLEAAV
jgi:hypothetical protein